MLLDDEEMLNISEGNITAILSRLGYNVDEWTKFGFCSVEFLKSISQFWLQFPAPNPQFHVLQIIVYLLILAAGITSNGSVLYLILRDRVLLSRPFNLMLLNLAVSDFIITFKSVIIIINSFFFGPVLGNFGCQTYAFVTSVAGIVSIFTWSLVAWDREVAVCRPMQLTAKLTAGKAAVQCCLSWVLALALAAVPLSGVYGIRFTPEAFMTSCSFDYTSDSVANKLFVAILVAFVFCVPGFQICRSYIRIIQAQNVRSQSSAKPVHSATDDSEMKDLKILSLRRHSNVIDGQSSHEKKLNRTVFVLVSLWFISWIPYTTVALMGIFGFHQYITPVGSAFPGFFCKMSACVDPFIYTLCHDQFQRGLRGHTRPGRVRSLVYRRH